MTEMNVVPNGSPLLTLFLVYLNVILIFKSRWLLESVFLSKILFDVVFWELFFLLSEDVRSLFFAHTDRVKYFDIHLYFILKSNYRHVEWPLSYASHVPLGVFYIDYDLLWGLVHLVAVGIVWTFYFV